MPRDSTMVFYYFFSSTNFDLGSLFFDSKTLETEEKESTIEEKEPKT